MDDYIEFLEAERKRRKEELLKELKGKPRSSNEGFLGFALQEGSKEIDKEIEQIREQYLQKIKQNFGDNHNGEIPANNVIHGAAEGVTANLAHTGMSGARTRSQYVDEVSKLNPYDSKGRDDLKLKYRPKSPHVVQPFIQKKLGGNPGSVGRANITNPKVNKLARFGGYGGGASMGALGTALAVNDIKNSENRYKATLANALAAGGGYMGGALGAIGGGALSSGTGGLIAPATVPAGYIAGSALGGGAGYLAGETLYDIGESIYDYFFDE